MSHMLLLIFSPLSPIDFFQSEQFPIKVKYFKKKKLQQAKQKEERKKKKSNLSNYQRYSFLHGSTVNILMTKNRQSFLEAFTSPLWEQRPKVKSV